MMTRAEALDCHGLPNSDFVMELTEYLGVPHIRFTSEGMHPVLMSIGHVTKLADLVRDADPRLAAQCAAMIETAKAPPQEPS